MNFRDFHLLQILKDFECQNSRLDVFLNHYFRSHRAIGSKDRRYINEKIYERIRWKTLFDQFGEIDPEKYVSREDIPLDVRLCFPQNFIEILTDAYGEEKAKAICLASNTRAPVTIRANLLKTTRKALLEKWKDTSPCLSSPLGIIFHEKINFAELPEFKEGLFEIQDEASQLVSMLVKASPKQQVLDFCAGSGGKTLALAPALKNTGQIYLHDIRPQILLKAKKRLRRAGIQNVQFGLPKHKKSMDWVLVDAPCTGSGTLRRNPDMKWKFDRSLLDRLVIEQRQIFEQALEYLHPKGKIVYATCSLFPQENQHQIQYFQEKFGLKLAGEVFQSFPEKNGMDGFFAAVLISSV